MIRKPEIYKDLIEVYYESLNNPKSEKDITKLLKQYNNSTSYRAYHIIENLDTLLANYLKDKQIRKEMTEKIIDTIS
jgi:hypothetical protein